MTRQVKGDIWINEKNGTIDIGFNRSFIDQILTECYHITLASAVMLVKDRPMLTIETNEGLKVIRSPCTGTIVQFSAAARDFPDTLTEETTVLTVRPKSSVAVPQSKKESKPAEYDMVLEQDIARERAILRQRDHNRLVQEAARNARADLFAQAARWPLENNENNNNDEEE